jgi:hypothetical protein
VKNNNHVGINSLVKTPPQLNAYKCYSSDIVPNQQLFDQMKLPAASCRKFATSMSQSVLRNYLGD